MSETARCAGPFRSSCTALAWLTIASVVPWGPPFTPSAAADRFGIWVQARQLA